MAALLTVPRTVPIVRIGLGGAAGVTVALWAWDDLGGGILRRAPDH